jgi:hypothetical protein
MGREGHKPFCQSPKSQGPELELYQSGKARTAEITHHRFSFGGRWLRNKYWEGVIVIIFKVGEK